MLTALALLLAAAPDVYALRWHLKEGDVFYHLLSSEMTQQIEVMGQKIDQKITTRTVVRCKVITVGKAATVIEMTWMENTINAPGLPGSSVAEKLKGVTFTATMNDAMELTKLDGYDKFIEALAGDDEAQRRQFRALLPEPTLRQTLSQPFSLPPDMPVAVGETWNRKTALALGVLGTLELKEVFRLDSVKDRIATISQKAELAFKAGDGEGGVPFKITKADLRADRFVGRSTFDLRAGRLLKSSVDLDLSGFMSISVAGRTADARLIQKLKTVIEITEHNPVKD